MKDTAGEQLVELQSNERLDRRHITVGALIQAAFTFLSRVAGMLRDVMLYHTFGVGFITDAFNIAFTIPNVLRRFFAEGAFAVAFVPVYIASKDKDGEKVAREFYRDAFGFLFLSLVMVSVGGVLCSKTLVHMFAYGFSANAEQLLLTERMTQWMFPYVLLVSIVALFGAYLQCHRRYAAMSASPIFLNLAMIVTQYYCISWFDPPVMVLAFGVVAGGILQVGLMIVALQRANLWVWPRFNFKTDAMKHLLKLLGPALFGVFVYQLNIIVLRQLASFLGEGQISYYYNADRLTQFATGVFGVSIATAALPELSRGVAQQGNKLFFDTLRFTLVLTSFVITPCAIGLMVFAYPIVSVLYVHGAFTIEDAMYTAKTLIGFSPSLIAFSLSRPLIQAFYAQSDTRTPVLVGIVSVILNLLFGLLLLRFNVVGLALTLSISSFFQYFILLWLFKRKVGAAFRTNLLKPLILHCIVAAIACGVGLVVANAGVWEHGFSIKNALVLSVVSGSAGVAYLFFAYVFKLEEARRFITAIKTRLFG